MATSEDSSPKTTTTILPPPSHAPTALTSEQSLDTQQSVLSKDAPSNAPQANASEKNDTNRRDNFLPDSYFDEKLFQDDNTGTRKYKDLLRGLKTIINNEHNTTDNPDLMPEQLATFYHQLGGDYNQLFLSTPSPSIAFIYKSLGCSYSLQPAHNAQRVEEPAIPALKTEGWIMWSTIQMLLGPDEHSAFLMAAVRKWDVVDPETGKLFPKSIPRDSFPAKADSRMCEWYEGVSERLKKEADEEAEERERQKQMEQHVEHHRRLGGRREDEEESVDSRGPALAYFKNPLYRHNGRPSIVRYDLRPPDSGSPDTRPGAVRRSSRPPLSPKQSLIDKGKAAAGTVGHVIRNVASPHLWDGNSSSSSRERRRRSGPDHRHHMPGEAPPQGEPYDDRLPSPAQGSPRLRLQSHRGSRNGSSPDDSWDSDERAPGHHLRPRKDERDHNLRHSRSHEPTPSQREYNDYFDQSEPRRQHDVDDDKNRRPSLGPSFAPSADLPFAAQVAQQRPARDDRPIRRQLPSERNSQRPYSPMDDSHRRDDDRNRGYEGTRQRSQSRYSDRQREDRPRFDDRDDRVKFQDDPPADYENTRPNERSRYDDRPPLDQRPRHNDRYQGDRARFDDRPQYDDRDERRDQYDSPHRRRVSDTGSRRSASARRSNASDMDSGYSGPDDRDQRSTNNRKQARFAPAPISGVDGRRYVDQSPWQGPNR